MSATTSGDVHLYQYKDGNLQPQTQPLTKPRWNALQPLSELATQYDAFTHSKFIQTTIPYPTQVPYPFLHYY